MNGKDPVWDQAGQERSALARTRSGLQEATSAHRSGASANISASLPVAARALAVENSNVLLASHREGDGSATASAAGRRRGLESRLRAAIPSVVAQRRREDEGILVKIPVEVSGTTVDGMGFSEHSFTLVVARNCAYISLRSSPRPGDPVTITNMGTHQSCLFRLLDSASGLPGDMVAWGVECLRPTPDFWQIRFPEIPGKAPAQSYVGALIECSSCHASEMSDLTSPQYHTLAEKEFMIRDCPTCHRQTEWRFRFIDESSGDKFIPTLKSRALER